MILIAFLQAVDQIAVARGLQDEMKADLDLHILKHDNYGKGFIKTCKISPDAYIQIALQLAHFKVNMKSKLIGLLPISLNVVFFQKLNLYF